MKRFWIIGGVTCGLAAVATVAALASNGSLTLPTSSATTATGTPNVAKPVRIHRVAATTEVLRTYTGVVKPRYESDLGFRVSGKLVARKVDIGDRVKAGQVIARLDPTDYELAVRIAEADLSVARAEAGNAAKDDERYQGIAKSGAVSQSELDRVQDGRRAADARVDRAQQSLRLAKNRLGYCELKADADGVVTALLVEVGQVVAEGLPVARIARAGELEAVVNLPENRAEDARTACRLTIWGESGTGYAVKLRELSPTADPMTRTYQARFSITNSGPEISIGRTVTIHLGTSPNRPTISIPLTAVRQKEGQPSVWRVEGDRLMSVPVVVICYLDEEAVIADGLRPGDMVVAAGVQKLDAGLRVRTWESK
jgi:membrane fusion protein, multidrug efflux system